MNSAVEEQFSKRAEQYDDHAFIQKKVAFRFVEKLQSFDFTPDKILELGAGTGFLSALLSEAYPNASILATDVSDELRAILDSKKIDRVSSQNGSINTLEKKISKSDLIASSMMIQWLDNPAKQLHSVVERMKRNSVLAISYPDSDSFSQWKEAAKIAGISHHGHVLPDKEDLISALLTKDTDLLGDETKPFHYIAKKPSFLLHNIKQVGAGYSEQPTLSTKEMRSLLKAWPQKNGLSWLTYSINTIIIRKKA